MPRVSAFISYSHDSPDHCARVLAFAQSLRTHGIDVELDQFHSDRIVDWPRWCNHQTSKQANDFVLCVCTSSYRQQVDGLVPPQAGKGAFWEGSILDDDLYDEKGNGRVVPILLGDGTDSDVPRFLRGWTHCRLGSFSLGDTGFDRLLRILTGKTLVLKQALGPVPELSGPETPVANTDHEGTGPAPEGSNPGRQPRYRSDSMRDLAIQSEKLRQRRRQLRIHDSRNPEIAQLDHQLRDLKRQMRDGPQLTPGDCLSHRYQLIDRIGDGGFGTVWRAWDEDRDEMVAVKVLHGQYSDESERRSRFRRGAEAMQALAHPYVVRVLETCAEDSGFIYFVMQYVDGGTLHDAIINRTLDHNAKLDILAGVGDALAYAHAQRSIHRDVTPDNILIVSGDQSPRLSDFDLVRVADSSGGTRTGALGKFVYAAPESLERGKDVDERADIFSLGMTAVFCLHGDQLPHTAFLANETFIEQLPCAEEIKNVLIRATDHIPANRYPKMSEFVIELRQAWFADIGASQSPRPRSPARDEDALRIESLEIELQYLKQDLEIAGEIQRSQLSQFPSHPNYQFFAQLENTLGVGGDSYDVIPLPRDRLLIIQTDVAGKGISAMIVATLFAAFSREAARRLLVDCDRVADLDLRGFANELNGRLCRQELGYRFVVAVFMVLDLAEHHLVILNAGSLCPCFRLNETTLVEMDNEQVGMPLGVMEDYAYEVFERTLTPGESVTIYSDGVTEAMSPDAELYGSAVLKQVIGRSGPRADAIGQAILEDLKRHRDGRRANDDVSLIVISREN